MVRALTTIPGRANTVELRDIGEPQVPEGWLSVQALAVGICGTDREIVAGQHGEAPPGREWLVLGHESIGRVLRAPPASGFAPGDLVVGIVRHPDPVPCDACAAGEPDMCRNGRYTEAGIRGLDGFASERFAVQPAFAVKLPEELASVGVLLEPASVLAKAWEHVLAIGARAPWRPRKVLVTGAGPVGLMAALIGVQLGLDVHVLDRVTSGPKPELVRDLGATYHAGSIESAAEGADVVVECTGASSLVFAAMGLTTHSGIVCLTGLSSGGRLLEVDVAQLNRRMVLENDVVFGSVNANRRHYEAAVRALAGADHEWLQRVITRRLPPERWREALAPDPDGVKTVIEFSH